MPKHQALKLRLLTICERQVFSPAYSDDVASRLRYAGGGRRNILVFVIATKDTAGVGIDGDEVSLAHLWRPGALFNCLDSRMGAEQCDEGTWPKVTTMGLVDFPNRSSHVS